MSRDRNSPITFFGQRCRNPLVSNLRQRAYKLVAKDMVSIHPKYVGRRAEEEELADQGRCGIEESELWFGLRSHFNWLRFDRKTDKGESTPLTTDDEYNSHAKHRVSDFGLPTALPCCVFATNV